jgi:hypothetical protein
MATKRNTRRRGAARQTQHKPEAPPEAAEAPPEKGAGPPPGLDAERHAASQRQAREAEVLREGAFPAAMANALDLGGHFDTGSFRVYLEQTLEQAGDPSDPIEKMLLQQICLAHHRIAQLHAGAHHAEAAEAAEAVKIYNAAAARLLGEFRRGVLALRAYRGDLPERKPAGNLKVFKEAQ